MAEVEEMLVHTKSTMKRACDFHALAINTEPGLKGHLKVTVVSPPTTVMVPPID